MNVSKLNILMGFLIIAGLHSLAAGQVMGEGDITIQSIRRVQRGQVKNIEPDIEITLRTTGYFYVGGGYYCLSIGKLTGIAEMGGDPGNQTRVFYVSTKEWKRLKTGDAMLLGWICGTRQYMTTEEYARVKVNAFANLDKKLLKKSKNK